jgi:hypothetical protein
MLRLIGLSLISCLSSSALAQDARMPDDCVAIAAQIQTETHVRFVHARSISTLVTDRDLTAELGVNSITMQCPPWASGLDSLPYSYVVTIWAEGSDPSKAIYELAGRMGTILTEEKPGALNEASRRCFRKALKSEFKFAGVLTPKATVKCQFDPDVRAPNVSIWRRASTDVESIEDEAAPKTP